MRGAASDAPERPLTLGSYLLKAARCTVRSVRTGRSTTDVYDANSKFPTVVRRVQPQCSEATGLGPRLRAGIEGEEAAMRGNITKTATAPFRVQ